MSRIIYVAIGILTEHRGDGIRVLIARRKHDAVLGGYWEFPGGKVEQGEDPQACLRREFVEELGVEIKVGRELETIEFTYPHGTVRLHPFMCTRLAGEPANLHVAEHRWVRPCELVDYRFPEANNGLIAELVRTLDRPSPTTEGL